MTPTAAEVQEWLVRRVGDLTGVPPAEIDVREPVTRYGLDSAAMIQLLFQLEGWLGCRFRENPFAERPSIEALARHFAEQAAKCK
jgi:acyl carrier protein